MNDCGYPYTFVGIDATNSDDYQIDTLVYRFESTKSGHRYEVHVERYLHEWFEPADFEEYSMCVLANREAMPTLDERMVFLNEILVFANSARE